MLAATAAQAQPAPPEPVPTAAAVPDPGPPAVATAQPAPVATMASAPATSQAPATMPASSPPTPPPNLLFAAPASAPAPLVLEHPAVLDTAHLQSGPTVVTLAGIEGVAGDPAHALQFYISGSGDQVTCRVQPAGDSVCLLPNGADVAEAALLNGAAQAKADAPANYHDQEAAAQAARRGMWVGLPPPPVTIDHPEVQTTAELAAGGHVFPLDGLIGFGAPYVQQMASYIASNGDTLSCQEQPGNGHFVCVLPNGTDIGVVSLLNGAARVAPGASDAYREQQGLAIEAKRGFWYDPPREILVAAETVVPAQVCCAYAVGDMGDGIVYVDGTPTAVIDGQTVFLTYGGVAGWGYYDHYHHWRGAPDRFRAHLDRFHPEGRGLRGFDRPGGGFTHEAAFREPGFHGAEALHGPEGAREGFRGAEGPRGPAEFHGPAGVRGPEPTREAAVRPGYRPAQAPMASPRGIGGPTPGRSAVPQAFSARPAAAPAFGAGVRPVAAMPRMAAPAPRAAPAASFKRK